MLEFPTLQPRLSCMFLLQWPLGRGYASPYKSGACPVVGGRSPVDLQRLSAPPPLICSLLPGPPPSSSGSTTDSSGMLRGMLFLGLLSVLCHGQASQEVSAEDFGADRPEPATDRDLVSIWTCSTRVGLWRKVNNVVQKIKIPEAKLLQNEQPVEDCV